ncbi:TauD/TfdA family dioxygenase [Streptomyces sp. NBC_00239]|uniref:TauD/TfdA family dioxygenase n=1 Tax=Streptomyces sp. NBC_00239 TaxID=2903640 RepID=UPI002E2BB931|nr:TauD/TfdA family dioxygenase [Streptomyces sp. NBC_00239]
MTDLLNLNARELTCGPIAPDAFAYAFDGPGAGRALVTFESQEHDHNLDLALSLLSTLGTVLALYPDRGCWDELSVRDDVDPGRTHGVGENRLHVDLVDRDRTPRLIALYCVRADPAGGGASALSDLHAAAGDLDQAHRDLLRRPVFSYFTDHGVNGVGKGLARFPVLPEHLDGSEPIRFTSKMLPHLQRGELVDSDTPEQVAAAFGRLVAAAEARRTSVRLQPGQLLIFDQWRYAHGRMPLGPAQSELPPGQRRLLKQAYGHRPQPTGGAR